MIVIPFCNNGCILFQNLTNLDRSERNAVRSQSNLTYSDTSEKIWLAAPICAAGRRHCCLLVKEGVVSGTVRRREQDDHAH